MIGPGSQREAFRCDEMSPRELRMVLEQGSATFKWYWAGSTRKNRRERSWEAGKLGQPEAYKSPDRWDASRGPGVGRGGQRRVIPYGASFNSCPDGACSQPTHRLYTPLPGFHISAPTAASPSHMHYVPLFPVAPQREPCEIDYKWTSSPSQLPVRF